MGKQGPCCHCGISTTPLWRNGPPDKPVLCNACGSRWRTKGTLANYMPMHSGGCGSKSDSAELKVPRVKKGSQKTSERKRKEPCNGYSDFFYGYQNLEYDMGRGFEEDASTRSSTGSGISYSESCVQHGMGAVRPTECWPPWECPVPSKRRSVMYRQRPSGKGFLNVHSALHESDSSIYTCAPEEDLLVEYKPSLMTVEIGLGGVFIRPPASRVNEQESQASSLMFDNKECDHSVALKSDTHREESPAVHFSKGSIKSSINRGKEKGKQVPRNFDAGHPHSAKSLMPNKALLENFPYNKRDVLQSCQSPLVFVELKDIVNIDTFMGLLTDQEQLQLVHHLSSADLSRLPDSLKYMFNSAQFESALGNFQLLLAEGMFDSLESGLSSRVLQHYQQLLTLSDLTTSGWMERCSQIFNRSKRKCALDYAKIMQGKEYLKEKLKGLNTFGSDMPSASAAAKNLPARSLGSVMTGFEDTQHMTLIPSSTCTIHTPISSPSMLSDATFGKGLQTADILSKERGSCSKDSGIEGEGRSGSCFSANSFHLPNQGMSPSKRYNCIGSLSDEVIDPDILLDLPSNVSFQQAELLQQPEWSKLPCTKVGNEQKQNKNGDLIVNNMWNSEDNVDWGELFWNSPSTGSVCMLPNETVLNPGKASL